ncbi:MAG: BolA family transcriptional regulator [Alphaproteobacteria bacterium]|nr:BolA family transcriptional regulator [Alphaproteobacteria bacterium]
MTYAERMRHKLTEGLAPARLEIEDDSNRHHGHAGSHPSGETHFTVRVVSEKFRGLGRVARQRLVYGLLKDELTERVHALALETKAPGE